MSNFLFSLNVTIPIFLVMVIGYFLRRIGMLNDNFVTVANKFNFKVTCLFCFSAIFLLWILYPFLTGNMCCSARRLRLWASGVPGRWQS